MAARLSNIVYSVCYTIYSVLYAINYTVITEDGRELAKGQLTGIAREDVSFRAGSISAQLPQDLTGSFSVILETTCGDFVDTKEYLMLIADLDIPIVLTDDDKRRMEMFKKRYGSDPFDAKRASTAPVIAYVDRWWKKINK